MPLSRRAALTLAAASAVEFVPLTGARAAAPETTGDNRVGGFLMGCQAWSFKDFSVFEAIEKTAQAGGTIIEFFPGQKLSPGLPDIKLDQNISDDNLALVKEKLAKHNLRPMAFGVTSLGRDEAGNRKLFDFAKKLGLRNLTVEPDASAMDLIEKQAKEYDMRIAIHNHPRRGNDANYRYWDPNYVLSLVKDRDERLGSCADIGHWVRSGIKPIDALRLLKGRIIESHLKDLNVFSPNAHDVPFGTGVSDIPGVLDELRRQKFDGHLSIEYEYNFANSLPEISQCIGFVRGYGARRA